MRGARGLAGSRVTVLGALGALALVSTACGGGGGVTVKASLSEWAITIDRDSVAAGEVTFEVENQGPADPHEFVVLKTDLAADALPTKPEGGVDEAGAGVEEIGEIEEFPVGESRSASFDLEAGSYVFICNLVEEDDGEVEDHYAEGMTVAFTVTG